MKHLLTIISCFAVLSMSAQTDYPFPWNPDADLDGWVSTEDLLLLLTVFGTQFEPDTWETDSISAAVVLDGNHNYFQCQSYCNDIEGNWRMADLDAFGRHFDLASSVSAYFWVNGNDKLNSSDFAYDTYQLYGPTGNMDNVNVDNFSQAKKCMCYIQSSPFVPSQFTEDSNLALWSSVSDLQEQVDSLQTALDSLQTSSAVVDSNATVSSPYTLECVDMGIALNCFGEINPTYLEPPSNQYDYYLANSCETTWTTDLVPPTWRKFCVSGLDSNLTTVELGMKYWYSYYDGHEPRVDLGMDAAVADGTACFYTYKGSNGMVYDGLFEEGVPAFHVQWSNPGGWWGLKEDFELLVNFQNGYFLDTGIRFSN